MRFEVAEAVRITSLGNLNDVKGFRDAFFQIEAAENVTEVMLFGFRHNKVSIYDLWWQSSWQQLR